MVKIDIEGAEYDVFKGASDSTLSKIDNILLEFHENYGDILRETILNRLEESGFTYEIYQDDCVNSASEWEDRGTIFAKR